MLSQQLPHFSHHTISIIHYADHIQGIQQISTDFISRQFGEISSNNLYYFQTQYSPFKLASFVMTLFRSYPPQRIVNHHKGIYTIQTLFNILQPVLQTHRTVDNKFNKKFQPENLKKFLVSLSLEISSPHAVPALQSMRRISAAGKFHHQVLDIYYSLWISYQTTSVSSYPDKIQIFPDAPCMLDYGLWTSFKKLPDPF